MGSRALGPRARKRFRRPRSDALRAHATSATVRATAIPHAQIDARVQFAFPDGTAGVVRLFERRFRGGRAGARRDGARPIHTRLDADESPADKIMAVFGRVMPTM